ncbi:hypothetical protein [Bartonella tribocorum]|nr:hypothetical protein [Bartonella tribocorum]
MVYCGCVGDRGYGICRIGGGVWCCGMRLVGVRGAGGCGIMLP